MMGFLERKQLGDKYREAITATVLVYRDTSKQLGLDPLSLAKINPRGAVMLGGEVGKKPKDSVWWVWANSQGKYGGRKKLADDLSKWRRKLNKQLKAWDKKSPVKRLSTRRAVAGGVVAAVVVATVVVIAVTAGAAAPAAAPAAAAAAGGGGGAGGAVAGGGGAAFAAVGGALKTLGQNADLQTLADAAKGVMSPQEQQAVEAQAQETAVVVEEDVEKEGINWVPWAIGAGVLGLGGLVVLFATRD